MAPAAATAGLWQVAQTGQATASTARLLKERKERVVHARLAASEWTAALNAAGRAGMTLSAFVRSLILDGAEVLPFLIDEERAVFRFLHHDLTAIAINLNALVRQSTQGNVSSDIADVLRELQPIVAGLALELRRLTIRPGRRKVGGPS